MLVSSWYDYFEGPRRVWSSCACLLRGVVEGGECAGDVAADDCGVESVWFC